MSETQATSPATTPAAPNPTGGPVGGHLTKKQRKEQFEALGALQTQLDVSVSLARSKVASWLNADAFSDDEQETSSSSSATGGFIASTAIKPRQPGLGLGAKFISHKDQMRHVPMNAFESKLKRQLTGGTVAADLKRAEDAEKNALPDKYMEHKMMMAARRKELQEQAEDDMDSRTRNIGNGSIKKTVASGSGAPIKENITKPVAMATSRAMPSSQSQHTKQKHHGKKYQAAVHPAVLKSTPSEHHVVASSKPTHTSSAGKKRPTDFFSQYMDERAERMAKKKKKSQAKSDPDDD
ncbi:hypothetical protein BG011_002555 [Mortierella polycephala]|uniref:Uncharacterized protein n=1 Tax=Mortierella polycephala TaxID=41804 RepID=A0A9P6Q335_9FUNG|nr:hypothetical protein BG011_002555 [Mortierella polycephala]